MAKQTPKKNIKKAPGRRQPPKRGGRQGTPMAAIALVGVVVIVAAYFAQFGGASSETPAQTSPVRISEVMASNATTLTLEDGSLPDWIEIENTSNEAINLSGYGLMSASKVNAAFVFPDCMLQPGEFVVVFADSSDQSVQEGRYHAPFKINASGGTIALLDRSGNSVDVVETPELERDQSYCRDASGAWQVTDAPTPGEANRVEDGEAVPASAAVTEVAVLTGDLEITEVVSENATYFPDENGLYPDYIEIHNKSGHDVSLEGWYLSDSQDNLRKWQFPSVTLPADGYLAVHCSGNDLKEDPQHLHTSFRIYSEGEELYLTDPNGVTVDHVKSPDLEADQAYSLLDTGWSSTFAPSPGYANTQAGADAAAEQIRNRNATGVYITEIMATSSASNDWIEIYNSSAQAVDLSGYGLSDNAERPRKWQFPEGTIIQPGAYIGVFASGLDTTSGSNMHANFRLSADGGYSVTLSDPNGVILDRIFLQQQYQDLTYGRIDGQTGLRYLATPTPGTANSGQSYTGRAALPTYSTPGGLYQSGDVLTVELSAQPGARIYYTLDYTDPDENDTLYTGPITITGTTILRTRVYVDGMLESYMDTQSYLYDVNNGDGSVYVVSLVSDPYNLTSDEAGIMVKGPNAWAQSPYGAMNQGANFWMDWEREAHVEIFNGDGSTMLSQECGIKLHGQYSRKEAQQAFKVIARSQYGSNRFDAAIFSNRDYTEYQSFLLRSSGQDTNKTRMRDSVLSALAEDTSVMYQETELCVVYLDGQYWGHYNIRERINTASICQFEGWEGDEDNIDLIKANSNVMQGSNETFEALLEWVKANDMNTAAAYQVLDSAIDIQNYIEYMAIQMFTGNTDTLNVKRYRNANADGKWRWVLFDLDWAFYEDTNSVRRWLAPGGMGNGGRTDNTLFIACMENDTFRDQFLTYLGQQMATTFSTQSMLDRFEERYNALKPILADQLERWGQTESEYNSALKRLIEYARTRPSRMLQFLKYAEALSLTQAQMEHYFGDAMAQVGVTYDQIEEP